MLGMKISLTDATQLKTINHSVTKQQESELKLWGMIPLSFFSNFTRRGEHNNSTITLVSVPVVAFIALSSVAPTYLLREVFAQHSQAYHRLVELLAHCCLFTHSAERH